MVLDPLETGFGKPIDNSEPLRSRHGRVFCVACDIKRDTGADRMGDPIDCHHPIPIEPKIEFGRGVPMRWQNATRAEFGNAQDKFLWVRSGPVDQRFP